MKKAVCLLLAVMSAMLIQGGAPQGLECNCGIPIGRGTVISDEDSGAAEVFDPIEISSESSRDMASAASSEVSSSVSLDVSSRVPASSSAPSGPVEHIKLSFAGDTCFGMINEGQEENNFAKILAASGLPAYPLDRVKSVFQNDDLTVLNYEGTLTDSTDHADKKWFFRGSRDYAGILPLSSVEAAVLSNNHASLDYKQRGFDDTVQALSEAGVGLGWQSHPYIRSLKSQQVVIISDCSVYPDSVSKQQDAVKQVEEEIEEYRKSGNIVIVFIHWGNEYLVKPMGWQITAAHRFIDDGADLIVGGHAHILQGIEQYKGRYIAYSLGNFAFAGNEICPEPQTLILQADLSVQGGSVTGTALSIVPCFTTSSAEKDDQGRVVNNYQPVPVSGADAQGVKKLLLTRSAMLGYGIRDIGMN